MDLYGTWNRETSAKFMSGKNGGEKDSLPSLKEKLEGITETVGKLKAIMDTLTRGALLC